MFLPFFGCGPSKNDPVSVTLQADEQLTQGNTQQAIDILEAYEERKPGNPLIIEQLAFAWAQKGEPKMAAYYFNRLAQISPDRQDALLFAAQSLEEGKDLQGALALYEQYLSKYNEDAGVNLSYARLAAQLGYSDRALSAYNRVFVLNPSGDTATAMGRLYLNSDNLPQATLWYDTALKDYPNSTENALMGLLEIALKKKNYDKAEQYVARLQKDFPGSLETSPLKDTPKQLAQWRLKQEELRKATAALATAPKPATGTVVKSAPAQEPKPKEPATKAPDNITIDPDIPAQAADNFSKEDAVAQAESKEEAANIVAKETAATPAPHIVEPEPKAPPGPLEEARAAREAGRLDEAAKLYTRALAKEPSAGVWNEYSILSLDLGNTGQAFAASLEATRMDPYDVSFALQYLRVAQAVYEPRRFLGELVQMRHRFPNSPIITLALARAYWQVDHNARNARILYDEFLLKATKHPLYDQVKKERDQIPES